MGAANPGVTVTSRGEEVGDSQSLGLPGATFSKRGLCGLGGPEASDSAVVLPFSPWSVSPPPNCWSRSEEAGVLSAD